MISPVDPFVWVIITVFLVAGIVSLLVGYAGYFVQKRPFLVPLLVSVAGVADVVFAIVYAQLTVPGFPGHPVPSAAGRPWLAVVGVAALAYPLSVYFSGDREFHLMLEHAGQMAAKQRITEAEKGILRRHIDDLITQNGRQKEMFAELKGLILTNVRHELLTPATYILGIADMIIMGTFGSYSDGLREPLETVHTSTSRLTAVVDRMVTILRDPHKIQTDVAELARAAVGDKAIWINTRRGEGEVALTWEIPNSVPVVGDPAMLQMALVELLNNAIKFGSTAVHLEMRVAGCDVVVAVQDDGIGIEGQYMHRIFEPLYQVQMDSRRRYEGAGNGLAAVQKVANAHGGQVFLKYSQPGKGSTFVFLLPLAADGAG